MIVEKQAGAFGVKTAAIVLLLLSLSGCATFDHVYWCLQSPPETGGPFCPVWVK